MRPWMAAAVVLLMGTVNAHAHEVQWLPIACAHIGASYDSAGNSMNVGAEPRPDMYLKGAGYWMIAEGAQLGIYWYSRAQGGATADDLLEQARYLARLAGDPARFDCLVIGLSGHFLSDPYRVTQVTSAVAAQALASGVHVIALRYPPPDRLQPPFLHYAESVTDSSRYLYAAAAYDARMRALGATVLDVWYDMEVVADGLHPDNESARRAARRIAEHVRATVQPGSGRREPYAPGMIVQGRGW